MYKTSEVNTKWDSLQKHMAKELDNEMPDIKVLLFLIGVQELGQGAKTFSKKQKEELMHIATCRVLSNFGFYELEGLDQDGWPHWVLVKTIPEYSIFEQEALLKSAIIKYFEDVYQTKF